MDFTAKLIEIREPVTGEGKNGAWKRQEYIFETESQYPRKICVQVWGDRGIADPSIMQVGNLLNVSFDLESREFNNRWYTDVRAWRIALPAAPGTPAGAPAQPNFGAAPASAPAATPSQGGIPAANFPPAAPVNEMDDLPF